MCRDISRRNRRGKLQARLNMDCIKESGKQEKAKEVLDEIGKTLTEWLIGETSKVDRCEKEGNSEGNLTGQGRIQPI